ncbi:T-lymphoma invasion and metastasis-inducing protein 2 [Fukomys damarensis]|uniref:T-lymphoma invasion and metastasis-inducing protein 2 n=1 Tax=Fukomys damarensis TaxID=885580 RepID=A0A091DLH9_FUKDA|nr:T-lymphoma invasion and metastasis-inducing protein 2 [Fukomys damarensis]
MRNRSGQAPDQEKVCKSNSLTHETETYSNNCWDFCSVVPSVPVAPMEQEMEPVASSIAWVLVLKLAPVGSSVLASTKTFLQVLFSSSVFLQMHLVVALLSRQKLLGEAPFGMGGIAVSLAHWCNCIKVKMGNSESQYTLQGSKNHSNTITGAKQKPCSLKIRSIHAKDEKSLHSWTQGSSAAGYKSRSLARSCLSHFKSHQPYASRLSGPTCKVSKGITYAKHRASSSGIDFQGSSVAFSLGNGFHYDDHKPADNHITSSDCNGHLLNCYGRNESAASTPAGEDRRSPRVLIKTLGKLDGCLRVEFHNGASHSKGPAEDPRGPVQLLRYSPTLASETSPVPEARRDSGADSPASQRPSPTDARLRSSKGSSLSSESSWYDSPWGNAGELSEVDGSFLAPSAPDTSLPTNFPPSDAKKPFNQSSSLSSLRDLYKDASLASHSPSGFCLSDDYVGSHTSLSNRVSFASDIDVPSRVEHRDPVQYSSFTLPCRKSKALTEDTAKKDTLKGRMRRISDWTGSLSRKKRKLQEPRSSFDSCSDGLNTDVQVPSPAPALLWPGASAHILSQRSESAHAIGSDPLQQNIYENFMRELEMSRTNTEHIETSTETVESSSESLSSLEQLDLLFEKEQGVVRKAGWLFFKPLVTLQKERKLELVARRKWKQYWVTLKEDLRVIFQKSDLVSRWSPSPAWKKAEMESHLRQPV